VFPSDDSVEGAYKLFLVHLDEVVATLKPGQTEIRLVDGHLQSFPEPTHEPPPQRMTGARWTVELPE
jgi:hypothetical protein